MASETGLYNEGFNSRTPCGVRLKDNLQTEEATKFQFTHPVWGATWTEYIHPANAAFQFTHPVWGATSTMLWGKWH